jgi:hypothetical protein
MIIRRGALLIVITLTPILVSWAPAGEQSEYEVKAAFLYNFTKFVDWPPEPKPAQDPVLICVVGDDPFGHSLDKILEGKLVNGRPLRVRRRSTAEEARTCAIAFISASEKAHLRSILETLKGASVLTVGDTAQFAEMGGVINFVLQDNRVHFEINVEAAKIQGLTISSRLLSLAKIVQNKNSGR